ncbi:radical SAM/SPASM domain-containing protein [Hwanghaeella sp.]|uniref:radical SAM/SPASM domain-containing protein n=1 Tax=Hwanghaeella sp. TaxID=2605943 RepID=UPI003CCBF293
MSDIDNNTQTDDGLGALSGEINKRFDIGAHDLAPPLPGKISIEINNSCNHMCFFCPNPTMTRTRAVMKPDLVHTVMKDAAANGIKEISFYSTGEPFLNKQLPSFVKAAKDLGFTYVYLSSNGGRPVSPRLEAALDAGLDSIKFSVNAGDRETYELVHGHDDFEEVINNIERCAEYRRTKNPKLRLFVSFVETEQNKHTFDTLKERVGHLVDEVVRYPFIVIGTPLHKSADRNGTPRPYVSYEHVDRSIPLNRQRTALPCYQLWSYLNVSLEGYLLACCSDFNADLVVGNLNDQTLMEAWHSDEFKELRQRHLDRKIKGTLCEGCVVQKSRPYEPINPHLMHGSGQEE